MKRRNMLSGQMPITTFYLYKRDDDSDDVLMICDDDACCIRLFLYDDVWRWLFSQVAGNNILMIWCVIYAVQVLLPHTTPMPRLLHTTSIVAIHYYSILCLLFVALMPALYSSMMKWYDVVLTCIYSMFVICGRWA